MNQPNIAATLLAIGSATPMVNAYPHIKAGDVLFSSYEAGQEIPRASSSI
ncbi:hypothetical protein ACIGHN_24670 [Acidovorax sp. NPDC077693]